MNSRVPRPRAILVAFASVAIVVMTVAVITIGALTNADAASHPKAFKLRCVPRNESDVCLKTDYRPTIVGLFGATPSSPNPGNTFTSSTGTWTNSPSSYNYQWEDCDGSGNNCVAIIGATTASYTVQSSDVGSTLRSVVTGCNAVGCSLPSTSSTSSPTGLVAATGTAPTNASAPTITGTPKSGSTLTASTGTWSGSPTSYAYQWQDCDAAGTTCTNVSSGGTSSTYTVASGDLNSKLRVGVVATNTNGSSSTAYSATTPLVGSSTLGYTTVGATCAGASSNIKRVQSYALASAGTLNSFSIYLGTTGTVGSQPVAGVVYADNAGSPGSLVATSSTITITQSSATQWYTASFPATALAAGTYWIGYISGSSGQIATGCYDTAGSNIRDINNDTFSGGATDPFGTVTSTDAHIMSLYVSYTPGGTGPVGPTAPTNLSASPGQTQVSLSWTAATETGGSIASYQIFRNGSQVGTSSTTSYTDTGLTAATTYSYYVKAVDGTSNVSGASNTASATTTGSSGGGGNGTVIFDGTYTASDPASGPHWPHAYGSCYRYISSTQLAITPQSSCSPSSHWRTDICTAPNCNATTPTTSTAPGDIYVEGTAYCTSIPFDLTQSLPSAGSTGAWFQVGEMKSNLLTFADWGVGIANSGTSGPFISLGNYQKSSAIYQSSTPVSVGWHTWSICQSADGNSIYAYWDGNPITFNRGPCNGLTTCSGSIVNLYGGNDTATQQPLNINAYTGFKTGTDPYGGIEIIHGDPLIAKIGSNGLPPEPQGGWNGP